MSNQKIFLVAACAAVFWSACSAHAQVPAAQAPATDAKKRGGEILSEAAAASGGEALKKIETLTIAMSGNAIATAGPIAIEAKIQLAYPDRIRLETTFEMGSVTSGFDGRTGWFTGPQVGTSDVPADLNPETLRGIDLVGGVGLYKKVLAGKAQGEFSGENEIAGQKAFQVEWSAPSGNVKVYFDAQTKLLIAAKYRAVTLQGTFEEERRWSDFRDLDGMKFPYRWTTYRDGSLYTELTVKDVKINEKIEAATFAKPQ